MLYKAARPLVLAALIAACGDEAPTEPVNQPPLVAGVLAPQTLTEGETTTLDMSAFFSDPDGDVLTYTVSSSNIEVLLVAITGSVVTLTAAEAGVATVVVTATDPGGLKSTLSTTVRVEHANEPPEAVGFIPDLAMVVGSTETVEVSGYFADPEGARLTYDAASTLQSVVTVDLARSTVRLKAVAKGSSTIVVTASDPEELTAEQTFVVTVPNHAPVIASPIDDLSFAPGDSAVINLTTVFTDPDGDTLSYTAESSNTDVASVALDGVLLTTRSIATGSATIRVRAGDPDGLSTVLHFMVRTEDRAPETVGSIPSQTTAVGRHHVIDAANYFRDPEGEALTFTAGSSDERVATVTVEGSVATVRMLAAGTVTITITATDPGGQTAEQHAVFTVPKTNRAPVVSEQIPPRNLRIGEIYRISIPHFFSDPDGDPLTYLLVSSTPEVASAELQADNVAVVAALSEGRTTVTATAIDPDGLTALVSVDITVSGAGGAGGAITFRDDFDVLDPDRWLLGAATAEVIDGIVHIRNTESGGDGNLGLNVNKLPITISDWSVRARLARTNADDAAAAILVRLGADYRIPILVLVIGEGFVPGNAFNHGVAYIELTRGGVQGIFLLEGTTATSSAINDGSGEFTDIIFRLQEDHLEAFAGDTELFSVPINPAFRRTIDAFSLQVLPLTALQAETQFDWVEMTGIEANSGTDGATSGDDGGDLMLLKGVLLPEGVRLPTGLFQM